MSKMCAMSKFVFTRYFQNKNCFLGSYYDYRQIYERKQYASSNKIEDNGLLRVAVAIQFSKNFVVFI